MTPKRIEEVLDRLPLLVIELDANPASRGPVYLQDLIYRVRNSLNETGVYLQEVLRWKSGLSSQLEALEVTFQIDSDELLASNQQVMGLPAVQDRLAMINVILRDQRKAILELKKQVNDAGYVEQAVRHRHRELEHTMSAVRLQRGLIETEIRTGACYGDESDTSRGKGTFARKDDDIDEVELSRLLAVTNENLTNSTDDSASPYPPFGVSDGEAREADRVRAAESAVSSPVVESVLETSAQIAKREADINRFLDAEDGDDFFDIFEQMG